MSYILLHHRLGHGLVGVGVGDADRDGGFARAAVDLEAVVVLFGIGEAGGGLDYFPLAAVDGIFGLLDHVPGVLGMEAHVDLRAGKRAAEAGDFGRGVVDQKSVAFTRGAERLRGRVRRQIGSRDAHAVLAVGKRGGIPTEVALPDIFLERFPGGFAFTANFELKEQRVPIFVGGEPAHADLSLGKSERGRDASVGGGSRGRGRTAAQRGQRQTGGNRGRGGRRGELVVGGRDLDHFNDRRHVFHFVGGGDIVQLGRSGNGRAVLQEARRGRNNAAGVGGG